MVSSIDDYESALEHDMAEYYAMVASEFFNPDGTYKDEECMKKGCTTMTPHPNIYCPTCTQSAGDEWYEPTNNNLRKKGDANG